MLKELLALGIPSEHARHIMDVESSGWGVNLLVGSNDVLDLTLEVFRPHSVMPVITAPFEKVYKQVAILWKQEFDTPKPTSAPQSSRYTRQQERAAAAMEERLQSEGLSDIQMQQVKSVVADTVNVLAQQQQQTHSEVQSMKSEHTSIAAALKAQGKCLEESVKVLQRLAPALQYNTAAPAQVTYPSQLYATGNMPAAPQQEARQPGQSHAPNGAAFAAQSAF